MIVTLPFPDKRLWPNGSRSNRHAIGRLKKAARHAAGWAAIEYRSKHGLPDYGEGRLSIRLTVYAMPKGPLPDADNCVAAVKAYLDGIAEQIGVNDRRFAAPLVEFGEPRTGHISIEVIPNMGAEQDRNRFPETVESGKEKRPENDACNIAPASPATLNRSAAS